MAVSISPPIRELASGVDALYLSGHGRMPANAIEVLTAAKDLAQGTDRRIPLLHIGDDFAISPKGWLKYAYRVNHEHGVFGFTTSEALPAVRFQPRSSFIHAVGPEGVVAWASDTVLALGVHVRWSVSRLDLFADWHGLELTGEDRHRFVWRGRQLATREEGGLLTGFEFGRRRSGLVGRIYDKTVEAAGRLESLRALWGSGYSPDAPVNRVEFEFNRSVLKEFGVDTPRDALARAGGMWAYATESWLSLRVPTSDGTRSRWPVDPAWTTVQRASLRHDAVGLERTRAARTAASIQAIMPALNGYLTTFGALVGADEIDDVIVCLAPFVKGYEDESGVLFRDRVRRKRWYGQFDD